MNAILEYFYMKYLKLHHIINHKLDIKNLVHFIFGVITGSFFYSLYTTDFTLALITIVIGSFVNFMFHEYFQSVPETTIVVNMDHEGSDTPKEDLQNDLDEALENALKNHFNEDDIDKSDFDYEDKNDDMS